MTARVVRTKGGSMSVKDTLNLSRIILFVALLPIPDNFLTLRFLSF